MSQDAPRTTGRSEEQVCDVVIVGASLAGLMAALALTRQGLRITLLERSTDTDRTGAALQVDTGLLQRLMGRHAAGNRSLVSGIQTWHAVHGGLRAVADDEPNIRIHRNMRVEAVGQDTQSAWARTVDQQVFRGNVVIGADGYQSVVRRSVSPDRPDAIFAGYLAWVGFSQEGAVPARFPGNLDFLESGPYHMLGFPLPGHDGSQAAGRRQIGWAWYDAGRNDLLRSTGAVVGTLVKHSLRPANIPEPVFKDLAAQARRCWPSPWREAMLECIDRRAVLGTPVVEYVPDRLVSGRLGLVGDAAHVATPMTGNGFSAAARDAMALADALDGGLSGDQAIESLLDYEQSRLNAVRSLVQSGQNFSRAFAGA
jgi:2-polyprenyl-6-methoxyphenol hydroxylase-like FAD-dependent oxidoreductase